MGPGTLRARAAGAAALFSLLFILQSDGGFGKTRPVPALQKGNNMKMTNFVSDSQIHDSDVQPRGFGAGVRRKRRRLAPSLLTMMAGLGLAFAATSPCSAAPILGGQLFSTGGDVMVEVMPATAGFVSELHISSPAPDRFIALNTDVGTVVNLGSFPAGVELIFTIFVRNTGNTFSMGPAVRNPDGIVHAGVDNTAPGVAIVGFEDLLGGGDLDYDDNVFRFTGGIAPLPCPPDSTVPTAPGQCSAVVTYTIAPPAGTTVACTPPSGSTFPLGTTAVTCVATYADGRTASCEFNITVVDLELPVVECPADIVQGNDPGGCTAVVNFSAAAWDNCAGPLTTIYNGFSQTGGGAPFSDPAGSFISPRITFATDTGYNWHPFGLPAFGASITGCLSVSSSSIYPFALNSDDGSLLFIDGTLVVDNGGAHAPVTVTGSTLLAAGMHSFEVQFYEDFGGESGVDLTLPLGVSYSGGLLPVTCTPASGSVFPKGTTVVTCTATDASGNTETCTFNVTVEDREAPRVDCQPGKNPAGKNVPKAGKNPRSGQNPDGFYQLLATDNCDLNPKIYVKDSASSFIAGPFKNSDTVKITQAPGVRPNQKPMAGVVVAHIQLKGDALLYGVDADGNRSTPIPCNVPPPPK